MYKGDPKKTGPQAFLVVFPTFPISWLPLLFRTWQKQRLQMQQGLNGSSSKEYTAWNITTRRSRLRKPRKLLCISLNARILPPKAEFRTGWTTLRSTGPWRTSENRPSHSGRPRKRTAELVERIRESVQQNPKRSVRKRSRSLGISRETCYKSELQTLYPSLMRKFWFQQDGTSSHTSKLSQNWLKENFGRRVISLKTDIEWAPHSLDLSPQISSFGATWRTECMQGDQEPSLNWRKPSGRR